MRREAQERLQEFFKDADKLDIPHKQNRLVIFNSNLLHKSMPSKFKKGYRNRRINLTLLFGARCKGQTEASTLSTAPTGSAPDSKSKA